MPEKLAELQRLLLIEAARYNVLPIDDRVCGRLNPDTRWPARAHPRDITAAFRRHEPAVRELGHQHQEQIAFGHRRDRGAQERREGVIIAQGGNFGGWSLYAKDGKLKYCYNWAASCTSTSRAHRLTAGEIRYAWNSNMPAAGSERAARRRCTWTESKSARALVGMTLAMVFSADDGCDVGFDGGAPIARLRPPRQCLHRHRQGRADCDCRGRGESGAHGCSGDRSDRDGTAIMRVTASASAAGIPLEYPAWILPSKTCQTGQLGWPRRLCATTRLSGVSASTRW